MFYRRRVANHITLNSSGVAVLYQGVAIAVESPLIYGLEGTVRHQLMRTREHIELWPGPFGACQQLVKKALVASIEAVEAHSSHAIDNMCCGFLGGHCRLGLFGRRFGFLLGKNLGENLVDPLCALSDLLQAVGVKMDLAWFIGLGRRVGALGDRKARCGRRGNLNGCQSSWGSHGRNADPKAHRLHSGPGSCRCAAAP